MIGAIIGMTQSGKSHLAQTLCRQLWGKRRTLVLDPKFDVARWGKTTAPRGSHFITDDPDVFADMAWQVKDAVLFMDEAGDYLERVTEENERLAQLVTRGSGQRHDVYLIAQRAVQIARTLRLQCSQLYLFTTNWKDAEILADDFNCEGLKEANLLRPRHYMRLNLHFPMQKFGPLRG